MSNDCRKFGDQIADLVTGTLPEPESRELQDHLNSCPACRDYLQSLQQEDVSLREYFAGIDEGMAHRQERALQMIECSEVNAKTNTISIWREIMKSRYSRLATAAAFLVVAGVCVVLLDRFVAPAYAIDQTFEALKNTRFLHIIERDDVGVVRGERWMEVGVDGRQIRYRQDKPPHRFAVDDGASVARYDNYGNTVAVYRHDERRYEWISSLGEAFENLHQKGLVLEENAAYHGRRVHKVWWPALRSVCYVDPETKLPVAIDNIELSYEEPPAGTFTVAIPHGYTVADGARESTLYATVELIQPAGTLVEVVNRDDVIRLVPTGPRSYEGDLDVKITCDTHVSWALSITAMDDVKGTYACWIDKFDLTPLGGIATVGVTLMEAEVADASPQSKVATVHLQVTPRPDPMSDARALQTLSLALYDAKRYEEALATFERMEEQDNADQEDRAAAVIWQGHMLDLLHRRDEAIARYEKVVGMGLSSALRQDPYGLHSEFTSYARERMTTPFTRVEKSDDR